jgi:CheY-like chemotaxis protein
VSTALVTHLIADDEPDMRLLVRSVLELGGRGHTVVAEACDGDEAVDRFLALDPPPTPDVVVLDNRMPHRSGMESAREILRVRPDQIVILFSAHLTDDVRREAADVGISACVAKDRIADLPSVIDDLLHRQAC